jgi:NodT family efflux transporter outer membrane factor (OMF) lipoprotein
LKVALLVVLAGLAASCTLQPASAPVPVQVPEKFSTSGEAPLPARWWRGFDDPVLDNLVDRALADNFSLKTAWDRLAQAEALARQTGAGLFPSLEAGADVSRTRSRQNGTSATNDSFSLDVQLSYELDLWGRIRSTRDAARLDARASAMDLRTAALTLSAEVADTWYQLVEQYGQLDLLAAQRQANEQVLELVTLQFRTGQVGAEDVLQQRQLLESLRGEQAQAAAEARVLEHQLSVLLGLAPGTFKPERINLLPSLPPLPATGLPADLVTRRPDVHRARFAALAADRRLTAAVADRLPQLSLAARAATSGSSASDLFHNWLTSLAANLTAPLLDGGRRRAEVDRTRAVRSERVHDYGQAILTALQEVEDALVREQRQAEVIASLDRQLQLAGQVIERVRDRYTQGGESYQRVLGALLSRQALQRKRLTAARNRIGYRIALCRALAGGWEMEAAR